MLFSSLAISLSNSLTESFGLSFLCWDNGNEMLDSFLSVKNSDESISSSLDLFKPVGYGLVSGNITFSNEKRNIFPPF